MSDARIEKIRARDKMCWGPLMDDPGYIDRHTLLEEVDRLNTRVTKMTATAVTHVEERDALRERLKDAEEYGEEYIERTDPALQCDYWWRFDNNYKEAGKKCAGCRRCAIEERDRLKNELSEARDLIDSLEGDPEQQMWAERERKNERRRCVQITQHFENEHGYLGGAFKMVRAAIEKSQP